MNFLIHSERKQPGFNMKPGRIYRADGYMARMNKFNGKWELLLDGQIIADESHENFFQICEALELKPFDQKPDTIEVEDYAEFFDEQFSNFSYLQANYNLPINTVELEEENFLAAHELGYYTGIDRKDSYIDRYIHGVQDLKNW